MRPLLALFLVLSTTVNAILPPNLHPIQPWRTINKFAHVISKVLHLPSWETPNVPCQTDQDCPPPFSCCNDPFFPFVEKYCCTNYKPRIYDPLYIYDIIQP